MNRSLISVIIPTHNRALLLKRALDSVYSQTYRPLEVIVINDGCTDNTDEIVKGFLKSDKNIKLIYLKQENKERVSARNYGITKATGEYICFLDDDDEFLPEKIKTEVEFLDSHKDVALVFDTSLTKDGQEMIKPKSLLSFGLKPGNKQSIYKVLCRRNVIPIINVLIRSSVLKKEHFSSKYDSHEDYELWLRLLQKGYEFDFIDVPLAVIYYHEYTSEYGEKIRRDLLRILFDRINSFPLYFSDMLTQIDSIKKNLFKYYRKTGKAENLNSFKIFYNSELARVVGQQKKDVGKLYRGVPKYMQMFGLKYWQFKSSI